MDSLESISNRRNMLMEIYTIDGKVALQSRKNRASLDYTKTKENPIIQKRVVTPSVFRFRKKSITTIVYLNIMKRKRMLELVSQSDLHLNQKDSPKTI
jgi:hypothetical protein